MLDYDRITEKVAQRIIDDWFVGTVSSTDEIVIGGIHPRMVGTQFEHYDFEFYVNWIYHSSIDLTEKDVEHYIKENV